MLAPRAIEDYLARKADNFLWLKTLPDRDLDEMLADVKPQPQFDIPLNRAQKVGFILGVAHPQFLYHLEMGTGKTRLTLELLKWRMLSGKVKNALILANADTVVLGWQDEILKWDIGIPFVLLLGSGQEKWDKLEKMDTGIAVATHTGFSTMVSQLQSRRGSGKRQYMPVPEHIRYMQNKFDAVVIDESTRVGNHQSLSFKVCRAVMSRAAVRYALAGRLFGRDPMPVWSQFYLVDHGESFGPMIGLFREVFFNSKPGFWGGREYTFNKRREPQFQKFLGHRSIYFSIDEVTDLPELIHIKKYCRFPATTEVYYKKCVQDIIDAKKLNYREINNVFLKMRQISSGFVGVVDDEDGEKSEIEFPINPKLELLIELLEELPEDRKAVIFHEFKWSGRQIAAALKKAKIKHGVLNADTKDWDKIKKRFDNADTNVLLVSWKKGAYGLNLQAASYCFFFESPVGAIDRDQCERRIWRQGQRNKCFIYDLVMADSVDNKILQFHNSAANLFEAVVKDPSIITS